jgi:hypothetical protein
MVKLFAFAAIAVCTTLSKADVNYIGSVESGDILQSGNWEGAALPSLSDTAVFPNGFLSPALGLNLGNALTLGSISWNDVGRELDLGGKTLTLNDASGTSMLSIGANASLTIKNGTVNIDSAIHRLFPDGDYGSFILTNATMNIKKPYWRFNGGYGHGFAIKLLKDSKLITSELPEDLGFPMPDKKLCKFIIDGGFASLKSQRATSGTTYARLGFFKDWGGGSLEVKNGGVLDLTGEKAGVYLSGSQALYSFTDSFLYQTNGVGYSGSEFGVYYNANGGHFAFTNSTYKGVRFNMGGKNAVVTFHDSIVDFHCENKNYAGMFFYGGGTGTNSVTMTGSTAFKAKALEWTTSSKGNEHFLFDGYSFDSPVAMSGINGVFAFCSGEGKGNITIGGVSNRVDITGGVWVDGNTTLSGNGAMLVQDGADVTGGVKLVSNGAIAHLKNGAKRYGRYRLNGIQFKDGVTNAVFVIEDSTYENNGNFSGSYTGSGYAYTDCARAYTNCPGSAIEFRGTTPKFINSESTLYAGGGVYVAMTFGSFTPGTYSSGPILGIEPLDNPVALRYVLPPNGYAEAPLHGTVTRGGGRPIALCGNARIEVDDSAYIYQRKNKVTRIPLIKDEANFTASTGHLMLDIDALNRNNAAYLPKDSQLEYVPADKTVYLKITNHYGFTVTVR